MRIKFPQIVASFGVATMLISCGIFEFRESCKNQPQVRTETIDHTTDPAWTKEDNSKIYLGVDRDSVILFLKNVVFEEACTSQPVSVTFRAKYRNEYDFDLKLSYILSLYGEVDHIESGPLIPANSGSGGLISYSGTIDIEFDRPNEEQLYGSVTGHLQFAIPIRGASQEDITYIKNYLREMIRFIEIEIHYNN